MDYETIQLIKKDMVATITLNRPKQLNALNVTVCDELMDAINQCKWDKGIRSGTGNIAWYRVPYDLSLVTYPLLLVTPFSSSLSRLGVIDCWMH